MKYYTHKKLLNKYSQDRSIYRITPSFVVFPKTEKDVQDIIYFAKKKKLSITPRGGGTGLSGAAIGNGIIVDFTKYFNNIKTLGSITRVQSGIIIKTLRRKLEKKGYMLPGSPLYEESAIGGNVNTCSIGPGSVKYGTIDNQIKSVRGVLANGRILDTSKSIPKDIKEKILALQKEIKKEKQLISYIKKRPLIAGGYNLQTFLKYKKAKDIATHLIVGSTGTLILLTEVVLKLPKYRPTKDLYLLCFSNFDAIQKTLNSILKQKPVSVEYVGKEALNTWDKKYHQNSIGVLIVGFESHKKIKTDAFKVVKVTQKERANLWTSRRLTLPKLEQKAEKMGLHLPSGIDDVTFHPKDFSKIMKNVVRYTEKNNLIIASFGHIGIGSLHLKPFIDMKKNPQKLDIIGKDIFNIIKRYNGTLIGEHNAGRCRSRYLKMESEKMYQYMKKVKDIFDPEDILNPKVIFNLDPLIENINV